MRSLVDTASHCRNVVRLGLGLVLVGCVVTGLDDVMTAMLSFVCEHAHLPGQGKTVCSITTSTRRLALA